jgi:hypothetical protein
MKIQCITSYIGVFFMLNDIIWGGDCSYCWYLCNCWPSLFKLEVYMCNIGLMDLLWLKKQQHLFEVKMQLPLVRTIKGREEVKVVDLWQTTQHHWCQFTNKECERKSRSLTSDKQPSTTDVNSRHDAHLKWVVGYLPITKCFTDGFVLSPDSHLKCLRFQSSTHGQMFHWPFCYNRSVFHWYGSWIYNDLCNQCLSPLTLWVLIPLRWGVLDTTLCDKVCQWLATDLWFSSGTLASSTNKSDIHDITEIVLKVALNTITMYKMYCEFVMPFFVNVFGSFKPRN